jgi:hypothetical protein
MVLILPSFSKTIWNFFPIMKFCPTSPPPSWSNTPCPFVDKGLHTIVISL